MSLVKLSNLLALSLDKKLKVSVKYNFNADNYIVNVTTVHFKCCLITFA